MLHFYCIIFFQYQDLCLVGQSCKASHFAMTPGIPKNGLNVHTYLHPPQPCGWKNRDFEQYILTSITKSCNWFLLQAQKIVLNGLFLVNLVNPIYPWMSHSKPLQFIHECRTPNPSNLSINVTLQNPPIYPWISNTKTSPIHPWMSHSQPLHLCRTPNPTNLTMNVALKTPPLSSKGKTHKSWLIEIWPPTEQFLLNMHICFWFWLPKSKGTPDWTTNSHRAERSFYYLLTRFALP